MDLAGFFKRLISSSYADTGEPQKAPVSDELWYQASEGMAVETNDYNEQLELFKLSAFASGAGWFASRGYRDVSVLLGGEDGSNVELRDIKKALIRTLDGNDRLWVEFDSSLEDVDGRQIQIFSNGGDDQVFLHAHAIAENYGMFRVRLGYGDDRFYSHGKLNEFLDGGEGDDYFEPGEGDDLILGGAGEDEVVLLGAEDDYEIDRQSQTRIEVNKLVDGEIVETKTLMDIEHLSFDADLSAWHDELLLDTASYFNSYVYGGSPSSDRDDSSYNLYQVLKDYVTSVINDTPTKETTKEDAEETLSVNPGAQLKAVTFDVQPKEEVEPVTLHHVDGEVIKGNRKANELYGSQDNDLISGGRGQDYLSGGRGDDILIGGRGHDYLQGDGGDDLVIGGRGQDTAVYWGLASEFEYDQSTGIITDLLEDFGQDQLVSVERIAFLDATYAITDNGVKVVGNGLFGIGPLGEMHVSGDAPIQTEGKSYQVHVEMDENIQTLQVSI